MINILIVGIFIFIIYLLSIKLYKRIFFLNKYKMVMDLLEMFLDKSYNVIYNDQIIIYTVSGTTKIQKDELETIERNFIKLSLELLGKNNIVTISEFYGDEETLIKNMLIYFRQRLEKDELVKIINTKLPI